MRKQRRYDILLIVSLVMVLIGVLVFSQVIFSKNSIKTQRKEMASSLGTINRNLQSVLESKIHSNLETLVGLSSVIGYSFKDEIDHGKADNRLLVEQLNLLNEQNQFVRMGIIDKHYQAQFVYVSDKQPDIVDVTNDEFIKKAMEGETAISTTFFDENLQQYVNRYVVPIYKGGMQGNGEIIGVLSGTDRTDKLRYLLNSNEVKKQSVHAHLVDKDGNFVIRNKVYFYDENARNIFDTNVWTSQEKSELKTSLSKGEESFAIVSTEKEEYGISLLPLGLNDWYIMSVVPTDRLISDSMKWYHLQRGMFVTCFIILVCLLFYIYQMMSKNNKEMYEIAYFDENTNIFNRKKFLMEVPNYLEDGTKRAIAVLKICNETKIRNLYGSEQVDELIKKIGIVLKEFLVHGDVFAIGRNENFLLLLQCENEEEVYRKVNPFLEVIHEIKIVDNQKVYPICALGIRFVDGTDRDMVEQRIIEAYIAVKHEKNIWKNTIVFFNDEFYQKELLKNRIENRMEEALQKEEFKIRLQPKIDLKTKNIKGMEALVRWIQEDGSMIFPDQFIPIFEKNGFCVRLDYYMVEQACKLLRHWLDTGYNVVPISVNQCRLILYEKDYVVKLHEILKKWNIDPQYIILEVTEGLMFADSEQVSQILKRIHEQGFRISMDDFGSGFSSLNLLKDLPIDELKLDRVFLSTIDQKNEEKRDRIMQHIIQLAKDLQIETVIEGIETKEQEELLRSMNCDIGQGYYYDKPLSIEEVEEKYYKSE